MKLFIVAGMMVLSNLAMASQSYVMEVCHQHIGDGDEVSQQIRSYTELQLASDTKLSYRLQASSTTRWQAPAQFLDVKGVILNYAPAGVSKLTLFQADGNHMGMVQTQLDVTCGSGSQILNCSTKLSNGNDLYLVIDR